MPTIEHISFMPDVVLSHVGSGITSYSSAPDKHGKLATVVELDNGDCMFTVLGPNPNAGKTVRLMRHAIACVTYAKEPKPAQKK